MKNTLLIAITVLVSAGAGCQSPNKINTDKVVAINCNRSQLWQLCQQELKNRYFLLDRVDPRRGLITTYPMLSKQWFEFWRHDAVTTRDVAESSLQTIRRKVTIRLIKVKPTLPDNHKANNKNTNNTNNTAKYTVKCTVSVERLAFPEEIVSAEVQSGDIFSSDTYYANDYTASTNPTGKKGKLKGQWVYLGRDIALERNILRAIAHTAKKCD